MLAGCVYALFVLTRTTLHGLSTVAEARFEAFQALREGQAQRPLALNAPIEDGRVEHLAQRSITYDGWWEAAPVRIRSGSQSIGGPWDSRSVEFATGQEPFDVHIEPLKDIAKVADSLINVPISGAVGLYFRLLGVAMRLHDNPAAKILAGSKFLVVGAGFYFYLNAWPMEQLAGVLDAAATALDVATGGGILDAIFGGGGNSDASTIRNAANRIRALLNPMMQLYRASIGHEVVW